MNCPVRTEPLPDEGHNQNPPTLAAELTTNNSLNHRANDTSAGNASRVHLTDGSHYSIDPNDQIAEPGENHEEETEVETKEKKDDGIMVVEVPTDSGSSGEHERGFRHGISNATAKVKSVLVKYTKFVGPGIMISVAYIDPGIHIISILRLQLLRLYRKLCDRCGCRCLIPIQASIHGLHIQRHRSLPAVALHQAGHCHWTQSRRELP